MTRGEEVIRPDFAKDPTVKEVKVSYANLFDKISNFLVEEELKSFSSQDFVEIYKSKEKIRLLKESLTNLETSAMYAVKALTV